MTSRAVFRIAVAGTEFMIVAVRMVRPGRSADLYAGRERRATVRSFAAIVHCRAEWRGRVFPNDRKIATLTPLLEGSAPLVCGRWCCDARSGLRQYAPEKSATLAYVGRRWCCARVRESRRVVSGRA